MANKGNVNARNATDDEVMENNVSISDLYKLPHGSLFWLLDVKQKVPARMPPTIKSPDPSHKGASYPAYDMLFNMVRSKVPRKGKERVYDIKNPADRPPSGWNIAIASRKKEHSRADFGGSQFVLCAIKIDEKE